MEFLSERLGALGSRLTGITLATTLGLAGTASLALAQDFDRVAPRTPETQPAQIDTPDLPQAAPDQTVVVENLLGMVFVASPTQVQTGGVEAQGIVVSDELPVLRQATLHQQLQAYLGKPATLGDLNAMTRQVILHYREMGLPVVDVFLPQQDVTNGVVQVVVLEGRVGHVSVQGNTYFPDERFTSSITLGSGDLVLSPQLQADADWINMNPFRHADVVMRPGDVLGQTDLELRVEDTFPLRLYGGYENTGTGLTGRDRYYTGINWGDAFGLDHQFNYQFTFNQDIDRFSAHSASYLIPLPWRHTWTFFGSYSETDAAVVAPLNLTGRSWQISTRYNIPLRRLPNLRHEISLGYDFKQSNNALEFGGQGLYDTTTDVSQFVLGYNASMMDNLGVTTAGMQVFISPGGMTDRNYTSHYETARAGADPQYAYVRLNLERTTRLPADFSWLVRLQGQMSTQNLLPSEQLGMGGFDTIRGFAERELNVDNGMMFSTELRTPPISLFQLLGNPSMNDQFQFLGFFDYGMGGPHEALAGEPSRHFMSSAGIGVRYSLHRFVTLRYDHGWQIKELNHSGETDTRRHHLGVMASWTF